MTEFALSLFGLTGMSSFMTEQYNMLKRVSKCVVLIVVSLFSANTVALDLSGTCSGTIPAGEHTLVGTCTVPSGETLTFEPGANLTGNSNQISIDGTFNGSNFAMDGVSLRAQSGGSLTLDQVTFTGTSQTIRYLSGHAGGSITDSDLTLTSSSYVIDITTGSPTITGNTFNSSSGVSVSDTGANPLIQGNNFTLKSVGIRFSNNAGGTANINVFTPSVATDGYNAIDINDTSSPIITGNTINDADQADDIGIRLDIEVGGNPQITGNTICATADDIPILLDPDFFAVGSTATISGNTFSCGWTMGIGLAGSTSADGLMRVVDGQTDFFLTDTLTISSGNTFTISDGSINLLGGSNSQGFSNQTSVYGALNGSNFAIDDMSLWVRSGGSMTLEQVTFTGSNHAIRYQSGHAGGSIIDSDLTLTSGSYAIEITTGSPTISGNTFNSSSGVLVSGTGANPLIQDNNFTLKSVGVRFSNNAGGTANNNVFMPSVATDGYNAIDINDTSFPIITGNTINDADQANDIGIRLDIAVGGSPQITGNTICATADDIPILLNPDFFAIGGTATISGNTLSCGWARGIGLAGSTNANGLMTVVNGQTDFSLTGSLTITAGDTFTINDGSINLQGENRIISIRGAFNGSNFTMDDVKLEVQSGGSMTLDQVIFTGTNHTIRYLSGHAGGSITDSDLSTTSSAYPIQITTGSPTITGNTFNSGSGVSVSGIGTNPLIQGNNFTLKYVGVYFSSSAGGTVNNNVFTPSVATDDYNAIDINGTSSPIITGNTIHDADQGINIGIRLDIQAGGNSQITGNTICATADDIPILLDPDFFAVGSTAIISGNTFSCGWARGIGLAGSTSANGLMTVVDGQSDFFLTGSLTITAGDTFTINDGSINLQGENRTISIRGALNGSNFVMDGLNLWVQSGGSMTLDQVTFTGSNQTIRYQSGHAGGSITDSDLSTTSGYLIQITTGSPTITGNTFNSASGVSVSDIGANPLIQDNNFTLKSVGVRFSNNAGGTANNNVFMPSVATDGYNAIDINDTSFPIITGNTINDADQADDVGIRVDIEAGGNPQITGNTICATADDIPVLLDPDFFAVGGTATISGNTFSCGWDRGIGLAGSTSANGLMTVVDGQTDFFLTDTLTISSGNTFTISDGSINLLGGSDSQGFSNQVSVYGAFSGSNFAMDGVSLRVRSGGSMTLDQVTYTGTNHTIRYLSGSVGGSITNSEVRTTSGSTIQITSVAPLISDNIFWGMSTGVSVTNSNPLTITPNIENNVFNCVTTGISLAGNMDATISNNDFTESTSAITLSGDTLNPNISGNTFTRNDRSLNFSNSAALFSAWPGMFTNSTFIGSAGENRIGLPSSLSQSGIIPVMPVSYKATSSLTVPSDTELIIPAGISMSFEANRHLYVNSGGRLIASGSKEFPVVFTGIPGQSAWGGISVSGEAEFDHCVIEFATTALSVDAANVPIDDCRISDSTIGLLATDAATVVDINNSSIVFNSRDGIRLNQGTISVGHSSIFNNSSLGINNAVSDSEISAEYVYWGHDSGPLDDSDDTDSGGLFNSEGQGQKVSDYVDYDPWAILAPTRQGSIVITAGDGQSGPIGSTLPVALEVQVLSLLDNPIENVEVIFSVTVGDASIVELQPIITNAGGLATAQLQLGINAGPVEVAVTARDINSPLATFSAEGSLALQISTSPIDFVITADKTGQLGDVNGDGKVNNHDAVLIMALVAGELEEYSAAIKFYNSADVNSDGVVDSGDALLLHAAQVGLIGHQEQADEL